MSKNYYDVLGVSKDADQTEIKKAFRKLAKEFHPDHSSASDAETKFKEINEAFSVLSDPDKRAQYDQYGYDGSKADGGGMGGFQGFNGGQGFEGFSSNFGDLGDLGSVFGSFFGGGSPFGGNFSQTRVDNRGSSLTMRVNLSFKEAVFGVEKEVSYVKKNYCENCKGTGSADGKKDTCSICGGSGRVRRQTQTLFGMMATESVCPTCGGTGSEIKNPCSSCNGTGRVTKSVTTKIKIPAGVESGMKLRFPGKGDSGTLGGESGDLYVVLNVKEDSHFQRNNGDIYSEISIDPVLAVLGGEIDVPTVNGNVKMKLPKGTQPGKEFRLKENGGPRLRGGGIGDHFVKINVEVPNKISAEEKQLWEKLQEVRGKKSKGFWDKLLE